MDILKRIIGWNYNDGVALQAESGRNVYEDNNPLEFNEQGDLIEKTAEGIGIITEYEQICGKVVQKNLLARREELNKARAKFCLESLAGYSHYSIGIDGEDTAQLLWVKLNFRVKNMIFLWISIFFNIKTDIRFEIPVENWSR